VSVRDSAAFLDATRGPEIGSPFVAPNPTGKYLQDVTTEPGRLRVALTTVPLTGGTVHPDCVDAAHDAATLMRSLGHDVEIAAPRIDAIAFNRAFLTVVATEVAALVRQLGALTGRAFTWRDVETETWALYLAGSQIRAHELVQAQQTLWKVCRELGEFFTKHDVLLTPTLTTPPPPHGAIGPQGFEQILLRALVRTNAGPVMRLVKALERNAETVFHFVSSLTPFNVSGQPAMSVPLYWNHAGLPIGVQIAGRFGDESTLFRLAGQLERARPWANHIPPGCEAV
jgi:amidase